jgi:hypothetical protein
VATKWTVVAVVAALGVGAGAAEVGTHLAAPRPMPVASATATPRIVEPPRRPSPHVEDSIPDPDPLPEAVEPPVPAEKIAPVAPRRVAPAVAPVAPTPSPLAEEMRLVRGGHDALTHGDAAGALQLLEAHAARFPRGALAEERDADRVAALCALGREIDATVLADRFLAQHGRSPLAARVDALRVSCSADTKTRF